tara:strand:- start:3462 stop:4076 length:615 start_codon:yes stop_codon:yes gene_type:complete
MGLSLSSAKDTLTKYHLIFSIIDSAAYNPKYNRGSIISHTPKVGAQVKPGRKIYLTLNPLTIHYTLLPDLTNKSLRHGISLLESHAFRVGDLHYVNHFAKDLIRFLKVDDKIVKPADSLPKFTIIDLYVGDGDENNVKTPDLTGVKFSQIKRKLNNYSLNLGLSNFDRDIIDTLNSVVYKQDPLFEEKAPLGTHVSVWLKDTID